MKPQSVAVILVLTIFSMCSPPSHAEVADAMTGKWKAAGSTTIFEVFRDGRYKSTINGVVVETGKMNATNGTWSIQADSGRVDNGSFTLNGGDLQLKGRIVTTAWNRISTPTESSTSAAATSSTTGSTATTASVAATASAGSASNPTHLSDKEKAIQRFKAKYGARSNGWIQHPPGGVMNDRKARSFWRGH